ncbi:TetR/AcrR family transcriptional regulator C-terminal domain-containing protein [Georgenia sp. TF02-10]|uniref:TetR/AcrR family transcriptional regulator n=1 Tax=Georgenia sp. TF02-10 TaxID=2917725 RepID=UPI001FA7882E|nr:TetR/AcrR family transcriptional regulator C-terminal domain-containing protein [Georgenia sp. TF02-10]UNX54800.1 TetR/AcrR family transcriptional regulator C-terminal domain-containing protein [Georgenia sp. TF02-10]
MTAPSAGSGDPARTIALLWRHSLPVAAPRRGPRQRLDVDTIVQRAVALADAEGLAAVTMRRVASAAGTAPMTLYTYVPGRTELVDLMLDHLYAQMHRADTTGRPWRERVRAVAEENRELFQAHPWAASVSTTRPTLGPGATAKYDHELAALDGLGLDDVTMDAALDWVLAFVQGWARSAAAAAATEDETAMDEQQWWATAGPLLAQVIDPAAFPLATRVGGAAGEVQGAAWDPGRAFEFGLSRVLDGLAPLIASDR